MCRVLAVSFHSAKAKDGHDELESPFTLVLLLPVDEIGKRAFHSLEHASRFILCLVKRVLDFLFHVVYDAASFSSIVIVLDILHGRAGKHSFGSLHGAASRTDIYRANWMRRSVQKSNDPDRFAALIRAQCVIRCCKTGMRGFGCVTGHCERAAGIQVQTRNIDRCAFGRTRYRAIWSAIRIDPSFSNLQFAHTAAFWIFQNNLPSLGLRVAFHPRDRHDMIKSAATQFPAHDTQSFVSSSVLLRPNLRRTQE